MNWLLVVLFVAHGPYNSVPSVATVKHEFVSQSRCEQARRDLEKIGRQHSSICIRVGED